MYMPVILRIKNLRFIIWTDDHGEPHVHILGPGGKLEAKIRLNDLVVHKVNGFTKKDINKLCKFIEKNSELLLEAWEDLHGEE